MATWELLRDQLRELEQRDPGPLSAWPDPRSLVPYTPPYQIRLLAWATDIAESLHAQFGEDVELTVGHLSYPARTRPEHVRRSAEWRAAPGADIGLHVSPVSPLTVASGHTVHAPVWVTNQSSSLKVLSTNGSLQSRVVDSEGTPVGCADGAQGLVGRDFPIEPGERVQVPVFIGTSSFDPALGYAVPPGSWALEVYLDAPEVMASGPLPLTITR